MITATYDKARAAAIKWHEGQTRDFTGEPYVNHPMRVAGILYEAGFSSIAVMAAMLHDTIEDTPYTALEMRQEFGNAITDLVLMVTEPAKLRCEVDKVPKAKRKAEFLRHLENASPVAQSIKLADIIDNSLDMARNCHVNTCRAERFLFAKRSMLLRLTKGDVVLRLRAEKALDKLEESIENWRHEKEE